MLHIELEIVQLHKTTIQIFGILVHGIMVLQSHKIGCLVLSNAVTLIELLIYLIADFVDTQLLADFSYISVEQYRL